MTRKWMPAVAVVLAAFGAGTALAEEWQARELWSHRPAPGRQLTFTGVLNEEGHLAWFECALDRADCDLVSQRADGSAPWRRTLGPIPPDARADLEDRLVSVGPLLLVLRDQSLEAYRARDGAPAWSRNHLVEGLGLLEGRPVQWKPRAPIVEQGPGAVVFAIEGAAAGTHPESWLVSFAVSDGSVRWQVRYPGFVESMVADAAHRLYAVMPLRVGAPGDRSFLIALDESGHETGREPWPPTGWAPSVPLAPQMALRGIVFDERVAFALTIEEVRFNCPPGAPCAHPRSQVVLAGIDPATGQIRWRMPLPWAAPETMPEPLLTARGSALVAGRSSTWELREISADGRELGSFRLPALGVVLRSSRRTVLTNDAVILAARDGLHAFRFHGPAAPRGWSATDGGSMTRAHAIR